MRIVVIAVSVLISLGALGAAGCSDKPNDEDCVKACAHGQELYFLENPDKRAEWATRPEAEQQQQSALCKQNCQNSGRASDTKCILEAKDYATMRKCTED
jgi:hypothetical protein